MENQIVKINDNVELNSSNSILVINNNIEILNNAVNEVLSTDKYNSVVTMDNFPDMKKSSQELGKIGKQISDFRIAKVKDETKDIKLFEDSLKSFTQMFKDKQTEIKNGLDVFEEQTRQKVNAVCKDYFNQFADEMLLREEFRNVNLDDMTQTGYATATFKISSKGRDEVERRVNIQLTLQTKVDNRLLNLENECLKAGVTPMSQEYVQGFLHENDEVYATKLNSLIEVEKKRAEQEKLRIQAEAKQKAEQEARQKYLEEQKALKDELHARYESLIKNADLPNLTKINIELKSYDSAATYELRELSSKRERELSEPVSNPFEETQEQEQHLKDIVKEPIKEIKTENGKVRKRVIVTFDIEVPVQWEDKVEDVYQKRFSENINGALNLKVEVK